VVNLIVKIHKSNRKIIPFENCVTKFHCVFPLEAADIKIDEQRGFKLGINLDELFVPVGVDITLEFKWWSLLKDIGFKHLPSITNFDPLKDVV
jgi:hypothetical protein